MVEQQGIGLSQFGAQHKPLLLLRRSALQFFVFDFVSHAANDDEDIEENAR